MGVITAGLEEIVAVAVIKNIAYPRFAVAAVSLITGNF